MKKRKKIDWTTFFIYSYIHSFPSLSPAIQWYTSKLNFTIVEDLQMPDKRWVNAFQCCCAVDFVLNRFISTCIYNFFQIFARRLSLRRLVPAVMRLKFCWPNHPSRSKKRLSAIKEEVLPAANFAFFNDTHHRPSHVLFANHRLSWRHEADDWERRQNCARSQRNALRMGAGVRRFVRQQVGLFEQKDSRQSARTTNKESKDRGINYRVVGQCHFSLFFQFFHFRIHFLQLPLQAVDRFEAHQNFAFQHVLFHCVVSRGQRLTSPGQFFVGVHNLRK